MSKSLRTPLHPLKVGIAQSKKMEREGERGQGGDGSVDYSGLSYAILHFKQLVDLCSQACRCSLASAAEPAVI